MTGFALLMLIYQGWRVFDYMGGSLTGVPDAVRLVVSVAFLAFSELGLLVWLHVAKPNATTDLQESVATIMVWVDFAGSMLVGLGDMLKHNTFYVVDMSALDPLLFLAPWLMVVLNIAGYLIYVQNDAEEILKRAERSLAHEEATLEVEARKAAITELNKNRQALSEKLAPHFYSDLLDRVEGRTLQRFARQAKAAEKKAEQALADSVPIYGLLDQPTKRPPSNGHHPEPADVNPTSRRRPGN